MAKLQSRRSVSLKREVFELMQKHCQRNKMSMSAFVEECIGRVLTRPTPDTDKPVTPGKPRSAANLFTF